MSDTNEKPKRKNDDRSVEWSFDFAKLGESVRGVFDTLAGDAEVQESHFSATRDGVNSARLDIDFSVGKGYITVLEDGSDLLFEATIRHIGELTFQETQDGEHSKRIQLRQKRKIGNIASPFRQGFRAMADNEKLEWHIKVAPDVALSLDIDGGVGPTKLDLTGLDVRHMEVDAGVGKLTVMLPQQDNTITAEIDGGVGQTQVYIPDGTDMNLEIDGGVGSIDVTVAPGTALKVKTEKGIGSIKLPSGMTRDGSTSKTDGYDLAERHVNVRYDGGVGSFTVREAEII